MATKLKIETTGNLLRNARLKAGLSQFKAAILLKTHVCLIGDHENSKRIPQIETLERYAKGYNVTVESLKGSDYED